ILHKQLRFQNPHFPKTSEILTVSFSARFLSAKVRLMKKEQWPLNVAQTSRLRVPAPSQCQDWSAPTFDLRRSMFDVSPSTSPLLFCAILRYFAPEFFPPSKEPL
ncbi:MAG TPA: hypothetical protein VN761_08665, partial [Candidatus Polarisedimenticolia bacterium]|nr:hypothetical protein [Candidatus Polarisedimenticolia bacterium]